MNNINIIQKFNFTAFIFYDSKFKYRVYNFKNIGGHPCDL